ncbi:uncharacterized protein LOC125219965 isoform X1 [Salvia hispanica]|uniref:uncharacterized protein LOC125219965 isoform X1 n=1 Tax=Salvia hispanica TaxID=49212 RepID=UPI002008EFE5|nr:uncharacterized protein LOC125219965 isoform X1 [Salvia hispanica]XP_047978023.1 uncharacterized protein LOC125219965 isoform X1 [Salvia hispanica]
MELSSCNVKHFIQTIRGGLVIKVCNTNSNGRPVTRTKTLKDVYDIEDAKRLQKPPSGFLFGKKQVIHRSSCFTVAARTVHKIKSEPSDSDPSADGDSESDCDVGDAMTLSQLKNRLSTKRKKFVSTDEKAVEDESDLNEPLINLKSKHSKASRAKRRCLNPSAVSSATVKVAIRSEENLVSEASEQADGELAPLIHVKVGVQDAEQIGSHNGMPLAPSTGHNEVVNPAQMTVLPEHDREPLSYVHRYEECLTNEMCYDHLEDVEPISILTPQDEGNIRLETKESECKEPLGSALEEITKPKENPDSCIVSCHSSSSLIVEDMPDECGSSCRVLDMAIDGCSTPPWGSNTVLFDSKAEAHILFELSNSQSSPGKNFGSSPGSITTSSTRHDPISMKDTITDVEKLSTSASDTTMRDDFNSEGQSEDESLNPLDKQKSEFPLTCTENECSLDYRTCDDAETILKPEQHQLPQRLSSSRKALSPSSQERLCLAMNPNSVGIANDADQSIDYKCEEKLFENETGKKSSSLRSEVQDDEKTVNHRLPGQVSQRKFVISPRRISKRSQIAKGNLEGPRFSRALPNLSTGCTSVQGCSESAVAFSQRQMQDMESVALKLMNELKSMKDIVEQKLLFEAYRNASLKNDADEIKSAIKNAIKAEETAKKWMSMMTRDCNRFSKIMKMMPDITPSSKDSSPKGERKITFADEAGGKLCHVKFFDDSPASPSSSAVEQ